MLPSKSFLRRRLALVIENQHEQGHDIRGLEEQLADLPDSYDALMEFGEKLADLPLRADWNFVEPSGDDLAEIEAEMHPDRPRGEWRKAPENIEARIETAFLSSVCGCVVGKPLEISTDLAHIRAAAIKVGAWPINDYIPTAMLDEIGGRHGSWVNTVCENIHFVEPDDDINYTIIGMMLIEQYGADFGAAQVRDMWMNHLPVSTTWGPERTMIARAAVNHLAEWTEFADRNPEFWARAWNPSNEFCGAQIRADAYGYACPGNPELAAKLAYADASFSHRRTGIYSTMWTAAAIASAPVAQNALEIFEVANGFVPQNSRFGRAMQTALEEVRNSTDWLDGYERLRAHFGEFGHCRVYFESATLINTLFHAQNIGDGFCKQVMQGNDTDSYGATSGSILGLYFGPGHLEPRWLEPFNDDIHTALAWFFERSLSKLAARMAQLPLKLAEKMAS